MNTVLPVYKVAIVDDSLIVVDRLQRMLRDLQNVELVGFARNFSEAKELIEHQQPGVLILDIHLQSNTPASTGINLLADIRKKHPDMIIMMLTNLSYEPYREKCLALGANYFFDKSNDFEKILDVLKEIS